MLCSTSPFIILYNFTIDTRCDPGGPDPAPESPNLLDAFLEDASTISANLKWDTNSVRKITPN